MFREKIKVLDCTIRDGGLINNHYFTDEFVRAVYKSLSDAGIDYMEMGYRSSRTFASARALGRKSTTSPNSSASSRHGLPKSRS
jgi:4-hydroxy 2-oxovalerate aldolase